MEKYEFYLNDERTDLSEGGIGSIRFSGVELGFTFIQDFVETPQEQGKGCCSGEKVGNWFGQENGEYLVCEEVRQNIDERNQQNDFPK